MRVHSYGKWSPNLTVGAVTIFSLIVLYSYWNLSTYNRDLLQKLHTAEQQALHVSKTNEDLQGSYDKTLAEKSKLEFQVMEGQVVEKDIKKLLSQKESLTQSLKEELEKERKESQHLGVELKEVEGRSELKDQERTELKSKVVSLEAQLLEEKTQKEKLEKSLQEALGTQKSSASTAARGNKESIKPEDSLSPAFVNNDPAEEQMNPEAAAPAPPLPSSKDKELEKENRGGEVNNEGMGVLPIPGENPEKSDKENLDAAEDDRDQPIKEEGHQLELDDQSPDGALPNENKDSGNLIGVGPPPPPAARDIHPQSGQDHREAAHLQDLHNL